MVSQVGSGDKLSLLPSITISSQLSSPHIQISSDDSLQVSGVGLALASVSIEQDAAYWEWHIESTPSDADADAEDDVGPSLKFGVSTKKNQAFYEALEDGKTLICYIIL